MNTERTEKFVNAIACDLEEGGFRQVSGTTLRRTLATAVTAALPLLADTGIPTSQPAELAEQQGVSLPPFPRTYYDAFGDGSEPLYTGKQMQDYARAALAATGKQLDVEWLKGCISSIHSTVSLGHQTGPHAYAGEDFGRYLAEAADTCQQIVRALDALAARQPGAQEHVAVVGSDFTLLWAGSGPIAPIVERHGLKRGSRLYAAPPAQGIDLVPRPMDAAPRDGTLVRLLVDFDENAIEDSISATWTIGACNDDNVSEGERIGWQFAGWCWTHDHFTEGTGTPVGWLPLIDGQRDAAPGVGS